MTVAGLTDIPLDIFSGLITDIPASDIPPGVSSANQDVDYVMGSVKTRNGIGASIFAAIAGNPTINYLKTFLTPGLTEYLFSLDSLGNFRQASTLGGGLSNVGTVLAGTRGKSCTAFGAEYIGLSDGKFGLDIPRQYVSNGGYFDRITQVGPGAAPSAADSASAGSITIGVHGVSVMFITRTGFITKPAPTGSWTAAGSKKVSLTNIPTGPPTVIGRIVCFTAAGGSTYFYLPAFIINDNTSTTATMDFADTALTAGTPVALLFNNVELGEVSGFIPYANRLVTWGERNKVPNFNNLTFDGGFSPGAAPGNASAGPNSPSAAADVSSGGSSTNWSQVNNIFALDGVFAACNPGQNGTTDYLQATGYAFAIPANATITGIVVTAYVKAGAVQSGTDYSVLIIKGGTMTGNDHANGNAWGTAVAPQVYGNSLDLWGATWAPSDINASNFGVALEASCGGTASLLSVDYISITVYYTTPGAAAGPLGWTNGAAFAGGNSALAANQTPYWGDAFAITGDGATAKRGEINQSAYQDSLGVTIIQRNTTYKVRARIRINSTLAQGTLHINLQSTSQAFTTTGLKVTAAQASTSYVEYSAFLTDVALVTPPSDLLLQVYADGTPTNNGVFLVDCIEVYPANQPFLPTQARASTVAAPETFDGVNGVLQLNQTGEAVRTAFVLTDRSQLVASDHLHFVKDNSIYRTNDNGGNPATWSLTQVSGTVGSPSINGVDVGEDFAVIAHTSGLYVYYFGAEPKKIAQEIQPTWNRINWQFGYTVWVKVDVLNKRILIGAPLDGATTPNFVIMLNYRSTVASSETLETPAVHYSSYTGKVLTLGIGRKWSPWSIAANCCWIEPAGSPLQIPSTGAGGIFLGGIANGKIYNLATSNPYNDDGAGIPWSYTTYFVPSHMDEQQLRLGSHRKLFGYLTGLVRGSGKMAITAQPIGNLTPVSLPAIALVDPTVTVSISSINRSGGTVTVVTSTAHGMNANVDTQANLAGVTDASFNGTWPIAQVVDAFTLKLYIPGTSAASSGGTVGRVLRDFEMTTNILAERVSYTFSNSGNTAGTWFQLEKVIPSLMTDPWAPVRGSNA